MDEGATKIRIYQGDTAELTMEQFRVDAQAASAAGYEPVQQTWSGDMLTVTYRVRSLPWVNQDDTGSKPGRYTMSRGWKTAALLMAGLGFLAAFAQAYNLGRIYGGNHVTTSTFISGAINAVFWFFVVWLIFIFVRFLRSRI